MFQSWKFPQSVVYVVWCIHKYDLALVCTLPNFIQGLTCKNYRTSMPECLCVMKILPNGRSGSRLGQNLPKEPILQFTLCIVFFISCSHKVLSIKNWEVEIIRNCTVLFDLKHFFSCMQIIKVYFQPYKFTTFWEYDGITLGIKCTSIFQYWRSLSIKETFL